MVGKIACKSAISEDLPTYTPHPYIKRVPSTLERSNSKKRLERKFTKSTNLFSTFKISQLKYRLISNFNAKRSTQLKFA